MKQNFYTRTSWTRMMLLALLMVVGVVSAKAVDKSAMTKIEVGTTYTVPGMSSSAYYYYEATETGKLSFEGTKVPRHYTDENFTSMANDDNVNYAGTSSYLSVEAGQTYYFKANWEFDPKTFTASFKGSGSSSSIGLVSLTPEAGSTINVASASTSTVYITFDDDIAKSNISITVFANGKEAEAEDHPNNSNDKKLVISLREIVYNWLADGTIKEGDEIELVIDAIADADTEEHLYNGDGILRVKYKAPKLPIALKEVEKPETFKTFWAKGNEKGIMKLVFDGDVNTENIPTATLSFGDLDKDGSGGYYREVLPVEVSKDTVIVDLTGVTRTKEAMLPNYSARDDFSTISVKVAGVRDTEGNIAYTSVEGNVGSYSYWWDLVEVQDDFFYEFTPADSCILDAPESIELYMSKKDAVSFDGVEFSYVNNSDKATTEVIDASQITSAEEEDGGVAFTIPVPSKVKQNKALNVKVSLQNQKSLDDIDRDIITAHYNVMSVKLISPDTLLHETAATIDTIHGTDSVKVQIPVELNKRIAVIYWYITNLTDSVVERQGYINKTIANENPSDYEKGIWGSDIIQDQVFYENKQYMLSAKAFCQDRKVSEKVPLAEDSVYFFGASKQFEYSAVQHVSTTPDDATYVIESPEDGVITMTFDGNVNINSDIAKIITGPSTTEEFTSIKPVDESGNETTATYSKIWKLDGSGYIKANPAVAMQTSIGVVDEKGMRVKGNAGYENTSNFYYQFENAYGAPESTFTPADGDTIAVLDTIIVDNAQGLALSNLVAESKFTVTDEEGNVVATLASVESNDTKTAQDKSPKSIKIALTEKITKAGKYTLDVPYRFFIIGQDTYTYLGAHQTLTYVVKPETLEPTAITPDTAEVQEFLSNITLEFDEEVFTNDNGTAQVTFVNKTTREELTGFVFSMGTSAGIYVNGEIEASEDGSMSYWTVNIPEGIFFDATATETDFKGGKTNAAITLDYVIGKVSSEETTVTSDPENGSTVESLGTITLTWPEGTEIGLGSGMISIMNADGDVIKKVDAIQYFVNPDDWSEICHIVTIDANITEDGTYTIVCPAGYFYINGNESEEMTFTYTVSSPTGINGIAAGAQGKQTIYTLGGQKVSKAQRGLYIINGKKVVVK